MKINLFSEKQVQKIKRFVSETSKESDEKVDKILEKIPSSVKLAALTAMFLLPTMGIVKTCNNSNNNNIEIVETPNDTIDKRKYLDITPKSKYTAISGDNFYKIAKNHNVSMMRLLKENNLKFTDTLHIGDKLVIPESYTIKNVKNADDVMNLMGFDKDFLNGFIGMEGFRNDIYIDINGNKTIGIGHYIPEGTDFPKTHLTDEEVYALFAEDLMKFDLNLEAIIGKENYKKIPKHIKASLLDYAFNRGEGAISQDETLRNALTKGDYTTAIASMTRDYYLNNNNEKIVASGLCKRRLFDMANACKSFKNGVPDKVLNSAKKIYQRGLEAMEREVKTGIITKDSYPNVKAEYKALAYMWYDGKIGEQSILVNIKKTVKAKLSSTLKNDNSQKIKVRGTTTDFTVNSLYDNWDKNAKAHLRNVKRPMPVIDKNGNIKALVEVLKPLKKGALSGKTIIINPGHGGAMNKIENNGKINVNFDPGTSNAVMSSKNPNLETNEFIGNGGKSLEEWVVNERIARQLTDKIRNAGGNVVFVQGSVYSAQDAIREIQSKQKINMIISLHSNSAGEARGIHIFGNKRGGVIDQSDKKLADAITSKMNEHNWFKGITKSASQSLGVLSLNANKTSPIPAVLIETGNLKNEKDVANLNSSAFKTQMVESIFTSIQDYLK